MLGIEPVALIVDQGEGAATELFVAQSIFSAASFSVLRVSNPVLAADYAADRLVWLKSVCRVRMKKHLKQGEKNMQTQRGFRFSWSMTALMLLSTLLAGCGINNIPTYDEQVKAAWAQVQNQYQRRADLIPNLVETVRGYAKQEQTTLTAVIEARAKATSIQVDASTLNDPEKLKQFQQAQSQLTGALSRLMVVSERYPDLKSNQNFLALQSQLEGTENRIAVARKDFIASVERYNTEIRTFPGRLWHTVMYSDLPIRPNFEATSPDSEKAPEVKF